MGSILVKDLHKKDKITVENVVDIDTVTAKDMDGTDYIPTKCFDDMDNIPVQDVGKANNIPVNAVIKMDSISVKVSNQFFFWLFKKHILSICLRLLFRHTSVQCGQSTTNNPSLPIFSYRLHLPPCHLCLRLSSACVCTSFPVSLAMFFSPEK